MTEIKSTADITGLGVQTAQPEHKTQLGQDDFFKLLTAQLSFQNPLEPQENTEFIAQMAQFGTLEGINTISSQFGSLSQAMQSNQALQASALVGREVYTKTELGSMTTEKPLDGIVNIPVGVSDLTLSIYDAKGEILKQDNLGAQAAGELTFSWNGETDQGGVATPGVYAVSAVATIEGVPTQLGTEIATNVDSVTIDQAAGGLLLNLSNIGSLPLAEVSKIR